MEEKRARIIAFYLPQFHPVPENNRWWGPGFTEWTNVAKARPLVRGQHQPNIPADLGFYDLRLPEVREAQAQLAREHGVEGFCYWHYWFGNGRRILELPVREIIRTRKPDLPFCLAWANETWTGTWHGEPNRVLIQQEYPGRRDIEAFFYDTLPAFEDERYIRVDGKPLFVIYDPIQLPECKAFAHTWNELAVRNGLKGVYILGMAGVPGIDPGAYGLDGVIFSREWIMGYVLPDNFLRAMYRILVRKHLGKAIKKVLGRPTEVYDYKEAINYFLVKEKLPFDHYPVAVPNFDNSPRAKLDAMILRGSTPGLFRVHLEQALAVLEARPFDKKILFLRAWNEWAEGNYVEPDLRFGKAYLEVIRAAVLGR